MFLFCYRRYKKRTPSHVLITVILWWNAVIRLRWRCLSSMSIFVSVRQRSHQPPSATDDEEVRVEKPAGRRAGIPAFTKGVNGTATATSPRLDSALPASPVSPPTAAPRRSTSSTSPSPKAPPPTKPKSVAAQQQCFKFKTSSPTGLDHVREETSTNDRTDNTALWAAELRPKALVDSAKDAGSSVILTIEYKLYNQESYEWILYTFYHTF